MLMFSNICSKYCIFISEIVNAVGNTLQKLNQIASQRKSVAFIAAAAVSDFYLPKDHIPETIDATNGKTKLILSNTPKMLYFQ